MGSYYLVALQMDGLKMLVASFEPGITVGETYNVSLKKDAIFHIL
jgi:hypothetical protein